MDPNAFLMGAAVPSFKFEQPGATVSGRVVNRETRLQTVFGTNEVKKWPSGDPMYQLVVHIQTTTRDPMIENDNGIRAIYIKGKQFTDATRDAVRAAGAQGIEVGGMIAVTYTGDDFASKAPIKPKQYAVQYQRAQQQQPQQGYPQQGYGQPTQAQQAYAQTVAPPWQQQPASQFFPQQPAQQPRQPVGPPVYLQHSPVGVPEDQGPPPDWATAVEPVAPALSTLEQLKAAQAAAAAPTSAQPFGDQPPPF